MKRIRVLVVVGLLLLVVFAVVIACNDVTDNHDASSPHLFIGNISPNAIAVCGGYLYWIGTACDGGVPSGAGNLNRIPLDGGSNELVVPNVGATLACNDASVYFWQSSGALTALPLDGGQVAVIATTADQGILTTNHSSVFWLNATSGVYTAVDGSAVAISNTPGTGGIAANDSRIFWTASFAPSDSGLLSTPVDGGPPTLLWSGQSDSRVTVTDSHVYWVQYYPPTLMQAGLDGGSVSTFLPDATVVDWSPLVTDGLSIYWLSSAELHRAGVDGKGETVVLTATQSLADMAVDDKSVYASILTHPLGLPCGSIVKVSK